MHQTKRVGLCASQRVRGCHRFLVVKPDVDAVCSRADFGRLNCPRWIGQIQGFQIQARFGTGKHHQPCLFLGHQAKDKPVGRRDPQQIAQEPTREILQADGLPLLSAVTKDRGQALVARAEFLRHVADDLFALGKLAAHFLRTEDRRRGAIGPRQPLLAQPQQILLAALKIIRAVHQGLDEEQATAALTFHFRQLNPLGPIEARRMVVDPQFDPGRVTNGLDFDGFGFCAITSVIDGVVAGFGQRQFAGSQFLFPKTLFGQKPAHGPDGR